MIRIKKLQDEYKNRIIELERKNFAISGPTRYLNKREIKQLISKLVIRTRKWE